MKKEELYREIGFIEEELIEVANYGVKKKSFSKKWLAVVISMMIVSSVFTATIAAAYYKHQNNELYIRYLSAEDMELMPATKYDADKFLKALDSDKEEYIYIAINRLVESYNDEKLRNKALKAIQPFIQSDNKKIANAAIFAVDILSGSFKSQQVYKLADGSVFFTLFNNYSDYGSQNVLWRIKDDVLEAYSSFSSPSMYIKEIIPSPDQKLIAIVTNSNKSEFVEVINVEERMVSPEVVESSRVKYGAEQGLDTWIRTDHENYSYVDHLRWKGDATIEFEASLSYEDTAIIKNVVVTYEVSQKKLTVKEIK